MSRLKRKASTDEIVQKLKLVGDEGRALFMIDRELAQRTFTLEQEEAK